MQYSIFKPSVGRTLKHLTVDTIASRLKFNEYLLQVLDMGRVQAYRENMGRTKIPGKGLAPLPMIPCPWCPLAGYRIHHQSVPNPNIAGQVPEDAIIDLD